MVLVQCANHIKCLVPRRLCILILHGIQLLFQVGQGGRHYIKVYTLSGNGHIDRGEVKISIAD